MKKLHAFASLIAPIISPAQSYLGSAEEVEAHETNQSQTPE